jgi:hypothetical protein
MFIKILTRLWGVFLLKLNQAAVKRILLGLILIFIGLYFFHDWEGYFGQIIASTDNKDLITSNLDKLFYLKIAKYITLSSLILWVLYNLSSLTFSSSKKESKASEKETLKKQKIAEESIEDNEDYFEQLEDTDLYPDLKTKAENILEKD